MEKGFVMNKILQGVCGCSLVAVMVGCVVPLKDSVGHDVLDDQGRVVEVSTDAAEKIAAARAALLPGLRDFIAGKVENGEFRSHYDLPLTDRQMLAEVPGGELSLAETKALRQLMEEELRMLVESDLRKVWVEFVWSRIEAKALEMVRDGKYDGVRKLLWLVPTHIDVFIRKDVIALSEKFLLEKVNPPCWSKIRAGLMADGTEQLVADGKIAELRQKVAGWPRTRVYTEDIESRLGGFAGALVASGLPDYGLTLALAATRELADEAKGLFDEPDRLEYVQRAKDATAVGSAEFETYRRLLADYRAKLIGAGCEAAAADSIVAQLAGGSLSEADAAKPGFDMMVLGSSAVNMRIESLGARLVSTAASNRTAVALDGLEKDVSALVADGKFAEAKDLLKARCATGDVLLDGFAKPKCDELLTKVVVPAEVTAAERELNAKVEAFCAASNYAACVEFLAKEAEDAPADVAAALTDRRAKILDDWYAGQAAAFCADLLESVKDGRLADARKSLAEMKLSGLAELDSRLCGLRIGLLEFVVNPLLRERLEAEIGTNVTAFCAAGDVVGLRRYVEGYAYPDDVAGQLTTAFSDRYASVCTNSVEQLDAEAIVKFVGEGTQLLDPQTTAELSGALRDRLEAALAEADAHAQEWTVRRLTSGAEGGVSVDEQIKLAGEAIAKQLAAKNANLKVNALLGEYARVLRCMRAGRQLPDDGAATLLLGGVCLNQPRMVDLAIEAFDADVDAVSARDPLGRSALLLAVQCGQMEMVEKLLKLGANPAAADRCGGTMIHSAALGEDLAFFRKVIGLGDVTLTNACGETAAFTAVRLNKPEFLAALLEAGTDVSVVNADGLSVFDVACQCGTAATLDALVAAGAEFGVEQLILAVRSGCLPAVTWLVGKGVDVNAPGVMAAAEKGSEVEQYLVREGGVVAAE